MSEDHNSDAKVANLFSKSLDFNHHEVELHQIQSQIIGIVQLNTWRNPDIIGIYLCTILQINFFLKKK